MSKHTPGPWEIKGDILKQCGPKGLYLARIDEGAGLGDAAEANARLIAAAPDLLAALREITNACVERASFDGDPAMKRWCGAICETARAAIAKAEGEGG